MASPLTVTSYKDNPDGTTTNYYNDGTSNTGRLSSNADGSYSFTPSGSINSSMLAPTPSLNYQTPKPTPVYPVSSLSTDIPELAPTPTENKASALSDQLGGFINDMRGESAYRTDQESKLGVDQYIKDLNDYSTQLKTYQNEADAIPLQLQDDATGRGITGAGLKPIQDAALRRNAIKALTTSSLLEATRGNLSTALTLADRATKQKFDPIREEIDATQKNLDLILKSPAYSREDKNRAAQQQAALDARKRALDVQEKDTETIHGIALQAQQNGAPPAIVQAVLGTDDLATAITTAGDYAAKETATSIQEYQFAKRNGYSGSFTDYQNEDANRKRLANAVTVDPGQTAPLYAGLDSSTATAVRTQVTNFKSEPAVTNFGTVQEGYNFAKSLSDTTTNPSDDQALIYALAKALDPGSVVREGEYATAQKYSQSLVSSYGASVNQAINGTGFLTPSARANIKKTIETKFNAAKKSYDQVRSSYVSGINDLTGREDGEKFVREYTTSAPSTVRLKDPKTGEVRIFNNLSPADLEDAKRKGYTQL